MKYLIGSDIIVKENSFVRPMKLIRFHVQDMTGYTICVKNVDVEPVTIRRMSIDMFNALYTIFEVI